MSIKHHQASVTKSQENAILASSIKYASSINVYDTAFSFPSTGGIFYSFNEPIELSDATAPVYKAYNGEGLVCSGNIGNMLFDWEGGGPEGVTSQNWQILYCGKTWGQNITLGTILSFKVVYSGNIVLSTSNTITDITTTTPTGNLSSVLINDWGANSGSGVKVKEATYTLSGANALNGGGCMFRLRYWNNTDSPHLVVYIKRHGTDDDYVLMSPSSLTTKSVTYLDSVAATSTTITDAVSWEISRDHDQINHASFTMFINDADSTYAYNPENESFGPLKKGSLVHIYAGYNGSTSKRFTGNIIGSTQVTREPQGAVVRFDCEGQLSFLLDSINFSYPNNASYSYAGYFTDSRLYTEPNGIIRPRNFDQWSLTKAIEVLCLQSGVDPYYLNGNRLLFDSAGSPVESPTKLLRDLNIYLSKPQINVASSQNVNLEEPAPIWEYDFGQDTAYDIVKDMLSKYGYFISEVGCGSSCGMLELVEISTNTSIQKTVKGTSTNYTTGILKENAEGYICTEMGTGSSTLEIDWTGKSFDLIMGIGPTYSETLALSYKVASSDVDWTSIDGYIVDGTYIDSNIISTYDASLSSPRFIYDGINTSTGRNPCIFRPAFGVTADGIIDNDLPYGSHVLKISKTTTEKAYFDSLYVYDYGFVPYRKYSTSDLVETLDQENKVSDIRNDIVVLGATYGAFSHVADPADLNAVKNRYITSRIVDPRSIYDKTYKYYIGRRKQFVIEDPTIVTQERADWLALYTLETYRQTSISSSIQIPADMGLQLYDAISLEDSKTGSVDPRTSLYVSGIAESYDADSYSQTIVASTRIAPPSFRPRAIVTPNDLALYFNNCPIAFEKIVVPIKPDRTGYDPMSSEDGLFIQFEWKQLVPGMCNLEIFDRKLQHITGNDIHGPTYGQDLESGGYNDTLLAVPYISQSDQPGTYRSVWDGVHEHYEYNTKFSGTLYELQYYLPNGHGFFTRSINTPLIDQVDPIAVQENRLRAARIAYFPAYAIIKYQPTQPEYSSVLTSYVLGSLNGTSIANGVANTSDDTTLFEVTEFDLEPRQPLFWGFNQDFIPQPSDALDWTCSLNHPYQLGPDASSVFRDTSLSSAEQRIRCDVTHKVLNYDHRLPYDSDGTNSTLSGYNLSCMPLIDETVGIRLFVDTPGLPRRLYNIAKASIDVHVITHIVDTMQWNVNNLTGWDARGRLVTTSTPAVAKRIFNYTNLVSPVSIDFPKFINSVQKLPLEEWTLLPDFTSRYTEDSEIFRAIPCNTQQLLNEFDEKCILENNTRIPGLGVGKVFAVPIDKLGTFNLTDLDYRLNSEDSYVLPNAVSYNNPTYGLSVPRLITSGFYLPVEGSRIADTLTVPSRFADDFVGWNATVRTFYGSGKCDRQVYNSIVLSINLKIIDRAGRVFFSVAEADSGDWLLGRHNEVEVHSQFSRDLLPYVNRWNPYLPTACYVEREPYSFDLTTFGGHLFDYWKSNPSGSTYSGTPIFPNFTGVNLTDKVITLAVDAPGNLRVAATPHPEQAIHTDLQSIPLLSVPEYTDGKLYSYFGNKYGQWNSYSYIADARDPIGDGLSGVLPPAFDQDPPSEEGSRDNTQQEPQRSAWGLPLSVIGGYPSAPIQGSATTGYADTRYKYYNKYLKDIDANTNTVRIYNQRGGLSSYLYNSPRFVLICGHIHRITTAINNT